MPDETIIGTDVKAILDNLEHYSLKNYITRAQDYLKIQSALKQDDNLSLADTQRLLEVCIHDMKENMRYTSSIMKILPVITGRVQMGKYDPCPDLLPSALAVVHIIKMSAPMSNCDSLKVLCFETLMSYPDDVLIETLQHHEEVMEMFNQFCQPKISVKLKLQAISAMHRILKILPREKRTQFVQKVLSLWFSKIIPTCMHLDVIEHEKTVELLEILAEDLVALDYTTNRDWHGILESICSTQKYPAIMTALLHKGSEVWHRIWIVFVRLLKHQVTQLLGSIGTPINSMLPVVESAFKMDVDNRCRAFECWNVLIDSFSTETIESNINKRIKLLIIPLKSNNAKAEATALAKFKCWWHLIKKFQNKIDRLIDVILLSFLHFCFGKYNATDKTLLIPGQISMTVKKQCIQAIVDMIGHVDDCGGCTELPKLSGKLINTKNLVDNWNQWVFSLTSAIMLSTNTDNGLTKQQMTCLWKSYLRTIGELPENNIRKDLFSEMLSILSQLVKECRSNAVLSEIVLDALVLSLFDGDVRLKELLKTKTTDPSRPLCKIIMIILDPSLLLAYESCSFKDMVNKLRRVTDMLLDPVYSAPIFVANYVLQNLTGNDMSLTVWTALAESIIECETRVTCEVLLGQIILWPLQPINSFTNVKTAAMTWYKIYDLYHFKLKSNDKFQKAMTRFMFSALEISYSTVYFKFCVVLGILKYKVAEQKTSSAFDRELELLHIVTGRIDNFHNYEQLMPILVDRIVAIVNIIKTNVNETAARYTMFCMKKVIKVMTVTCKQITDDPLILSFIESMLKSMNSLIQVDEYQRFIPVIVDEIVDCSSFLSQQPLTKNTVLSVMRTLESKMADDDKSLKQIKALIDTVENETLSKDVQSAEKSKFTTPKIKEVPKKTKKKEPSIVNTVVENGEEYVVVKSNWKFNPRKLTENQKEKLQRKREDIPALYQDLSQSQDECKLVSWKTDSQDASSSSKSESKSSKAGNNETNLETILNQSSATAVPKVLESFFANNLKKDSPTIAKEVAPTDKNVNKIEIGTPKSTKSPRMALKDRVFRNVRHLIENSGMQKENQSTAVDLNKTERIIKTPTQIKSDGTVNIVHSAPPLLADRPSRVKRKPKKFEELQLLTAAKKSRKASQDSTSKDQSSLLNPERTTTVSTVVTDPQINTALVENEEKKTSDLKDSDNVNSEIMQVDENLGNNASEINKEMEVVKESEKSVKMDLEASDKINEKTNEQTTNEKSVESSSGQKVESSTGKEGESPIENKVEGPTEKEVKSTTEKKAEIDTGKKGDSSTEKEVESGTEKQADRSTEKKVESSTANRAVICIENKDEWLNDKKHEGPKNTKGEICNACISKRKKANDIQDQSISDKDTSTNETICEESTDKIEDTTKGKNDANLADKQKSSCTKEDETAKVKNDANSADKQKSSSTKEDETAKEKNDANSADKQKSSSTKEDETSKEKNDANSADKQKSSSTKEIKEPLTPQQESKNKETDEQKSTTKKTVRKSRIEKELAIDMVEGHPYLKMQTPKRLTRKALESAGTGRRKSLIEKLNKSKSEPKSDKKTREKNKDSDCSSSNSSITVDDSEVQDIEKDQTSFTEDLPYSDDVIESSQDSTMTTISVKSTKKANKKVPVVTLEKIKVTENDKMNESQSILDCVMVGVPEPTKSNQESKDDSELPLNKTASEGQSQADLTENMDTEPIEDKDLSEVVIIVNDDVPAPLTISSDETEVGPETQEIAEADTQPTDPNSFMEVDVIQKNTDTSLTVVEITSDEISSSKKKRDLANDKSIKEKPDPPEDITITLSDSAAVDLEKESGASSPSSSGDEAKRKQDFLNNTLEISPIKNMSPERNKKSPSPETSNDYVVITLSSPVNSNGEPLEKCSSPEVFTEEKVSPDKRDQSPPRVEVTVTNTSPSSSLSLKKNRPQVRAGGRAAQMLGLCCVPDKVQTILSQEKAETEEIKKTSSLSTPARRNLRILYNSVGENSDPPTENEDSEQFLKLRRSLPAVDSSPAGPILKRKLVEIADDATISPASKRKRVSFHDPPVSTTVSVQKYIEPAGVRSPQNSVQKRLERQTRQHTPMKSPKRLDHAFKLDTVLNKAVESFTETSLTSVISTPDDTQPVSLDETPVVEIVRASELNDTDPICPELVDCKDPIDNIAGELSSYAMKSLLVKELVGKVETVGDLAKMTELEVNRLCIKAPKVKVARKVLTDYAAKRVEKPPCDVMVTIDEAVLEELMPDQDSKCFIDYAAQTLPTVYVEAEAQTVATPTSASFVQTETTPTAHTDIQTDESGSKLTTDVIRTCLAERPDFVEQLGENLEASSIQKLIGKLPASAISDVLTKKITPTDLLSLLKGVLDNQGSSCNPDKKDISEELSLIREYMCVRFDSKDLILFCSEMLKFVYDKP
ncbi:hypothetical protein PYW08_003935 [Mythimna loreyi]|uniref:Uncharacterized protein n=1 Tax=Mythimna loreyi TaxID=667449 RepID=A0ACC2QW95_9NEOP|nr:hypothetical protein PYW08_003935 [Mythimna loreyi]